jgi:hypothetical protein
LVYFNISLQTVSNHKFLQINKCIILNTDCLIQA